MCPSCVGGGGGVVSRAVWGKKRPLSVCGAALQSLLFHQSKTSFFVFFLHEQSSTTMAIQPVVPPAESAKRFLNDRSVRRLRCACLFQKFATKSNLV